MVVIVLFIKYQIEYENIHACNGRIGSFDFLVTPFIKENKNHENCIKFSIENQRHVKMISRYITTICISCYSVCNKLALVYFVYEPNIRV